MDGWIPVDSESLLQAINRGEAVAFKLVVSPYDIPEAVRGVRVNENDFRIDLRYPDGPEPTEEINADNGITLRIGRFSERLHSIIVDMTRLGVQFVGLAVEEFEPAFDLLKSRPSEQKAPENYLLAREALSERQNQLANQLQLH